MGLTPSTKSCYFKGILLLNSDIDSKPMLIH